MRRRGASRRPPDGLSCLPLTLGRKAKGHGTRRLVLGVALVITAGTLVLLLNRPALPTEHGKTGVPRQAGTAAAAPSEKDPSELHGTIRFINRLARAVRVSGDHVAARDTMLQITDDTRILVRDRHGSFEDLREGDRIRASYQNRSGMNIARAIDVAIPGSR